MANVLICQLQGHGKCVLCVSLLSRGLQATDRCGNDVRVVRTLKGPTQGGRKSRWVAWASTLARVHADGIRHGQEYLPMPLYRRERL